MKKLGGHLIEMVLKQYIQFIKNKSSFIIKVLYINET